ncbi:outer membrane beta-barrel protein [Marinilabilia salmonicolor]|uniref:outer membrane beta-barrel protein n=1 Tax=Marinilabilia salmonicolor TaxID=989 RepID=UPI00029AF01B|nr:outer membrane beta-barrel protein [Marinilabilia salmonicolor]
MKKLFLLSLSVLLCGSLFAQSFDSSKLRAGAGFFYTSEIQNMGLTLNGVYEIDETWEGSLGFTHVFEKDNLNWNMLDLDGHYIFHEESDDLNIYGLAGLSFTFWKVTIPAMDLGMFGSTDEQEETGSEIGLNLGIGANYRIADNLNLAPELRYTIIDGSYFRLGATLQYMF